MHNRCSWYKLLAHVKYYCSLLCVFITTKWFLLQVATNSFLILWQISSLKFTSPYTFHNEGSTEENQISHIKFYSQFYSQPNAPIKQVELVKDVNKRTTTDSSIHLLFNPFIQKMTTLPTLSFTQKAPDSEEGWTYLSHWKSDKTSNCCKKNSTDSLIAEDSDSAVFKLTNTKYSVVLLLIAFHESTAFPRP